MKEKLAEKLKKVQAAIQQIEKHFGRGAIMSLGDEGAMQPVEVIPSGSLGVDLALGLGGLPRGRIVEIFGPESSGKTTLALHAIASTQKEGGVCAFIDAEHALDVRYAEGLGVQPGQLLVSQPDSGEQALEIAESLVRSGAVDLVVVDSVAALVPRAEIEGEMGDQHMGLQARLMSQAMRKLAGVAYRSQSTLIFINQLRQKIGVVFGNPEVTTGGNALKFYASVRIEVRRTGAIKDQHGTTGHRTRIKVVKNKLAPPFREVEVDILYGRGIWWAGDLLDRALDAGVCERSGAWVSFDGRQLGQGREKAALEIEADVSLAGAIRKAVLRSRAPQGAPRKKGAKTAGSPGGGEKGERAA